MVGIKLHVARWLDLIPAKISGFNLLTHWWMGEASDFPDRLLVSKLVLGKCSDIKAEYLPEYSFMLK